MGMERMIGAEFLELILDEGWNPARVPLIKVPGDPDEGQKVFARFDLFNRDGFTGHAISFRGK